MISSPTPLLPASSTTRRTWLLSVPALTALLGACAALDPPHSVTLSESELQRLIERAFPLDKRLLDVLDVVVSSPRLRLIPERNRVATELEVSSKDRLFGSQWSGRIALESALRYEASDQSLRLSQVRVNDFKLNSGNNSSTGPRGIASQAERLGSVLAERVLEGFSVYRLSPERAAKLQRAGVTPGQVSINSRGVEITLLPTP
jgi:hypothetical protein